MAKRETIKPEVTVLDNGFTVVTRNAPNEEQTRVNLSVHVGSRHESEQESGMSHFLEHMLAAATKKLSKSERTERIEEMEGTTNANTGFEQTQYYIHADGPHVEEVIGMIADNMKNPLMDADDIEKERGAIISEINGRLDNPQTKLVFNLLGTAFAGTSLGRYIGGTPDTVAQMTKEQLEDFKDRHYTSDNMVLTVVGDVDHDQIVEYAKANFGDIAHSTPEHNLEAAPGHYRGGYNVVPNDNMNQLSFAMSFEGSADQDMKGNLEEVILAKILGGGMGSRLMKKLRLDQGLVYYAQAGAESFSDCGTFLVMAGFDAEQNGEKAIQGTCEELLRATEDLTQREFDLAKSALLGSVKRGKNDVESITSSISGSMVSHGRPVTIEEQLEVLESITLDDLKERAAKVFSTAPTVAAIGKDADKLPSYEQITGWLGNPRELDESGLVKENAPSADRAAADASVAAEPAATKQRAVG